MSVESGVRYTVASVPFVNARPLVERFEQEPSTVRVVYDLPSRLPAMIDSGEVQAAMVSSFEALRTPGRVIAEGASISTLGEAQSVRLFSKVPFKQIRTLALDSSSLTSIHLAQVLLIERYGVRAQTVSLSPDLREMLRHCDAALLIGDKGMTADGAGQHVLDLGSEWLALTGKPFVWAAWIGADWLTPELAGLLEEAKQWGVAHVHEIAEHVAPKAGWALDVCDRYLSEIMNYDLSLQHLQGLRAFQELLVKHGFLSEALPLRLVSTQQTQPALR